MPIPLRDNIEGTLRPRAEKRPRRTNVEIITEAPTTSPARGGGQGNRVTSPTRTAGCAVRPGARGRALLTPPPNSVGGRLMLTHQHGAEPRRVHTLNMLSLHVRQQREVGVHVPHRDVDNLDRRSLRPCSECTLECARELGQGRRGSARRDHRKPGVHHLRESFESSSTIREAAEKPRLKEAVQTDNLLFARQGDIHPRRMQGGVCSGRL